MARFQEANTGPRRQRRIRKATDAHRRPAPAPTAGPIVDASAPSPLSHLPLDGLPFDVLVTVLDHLRSLADLLSLRATCRAWRAALGDDDDSLMSALCSRYFPGLGRLLRELFGAERTVKPGDRCPSLALIYVHCAPRATGELSQSQHVARCFGPYGGLRYWGQVSDSGRPHGYGFMIVTPPHPKRRNHNAAPRIAAPGDDDGIGNTRSSNDDDDSDEDDEENDGDDVAFQLTNGNWYCGLGPTTAPTSALSPDVATSGPTLPAAAVTAAAATTTTTTTLMVSATGDSDRPEELPQKPLHHDALWRVGDWLLGRWVNGLLVNGLATCRSGSLSPCRSDWFGMYVLGKRVLCNSACDQAYYQGRVSQGRFHGKGAWIARHDSPCQPAEALTKCGKFSNGQPAFGRMEYEAGLTYLGEWRGGQFGGHGTLVRHDNNSKYTGQWNLGREHGFGTRTLLNPDLPGPWNADARAAMVIARQGAPVELGPAMTSYSGNWCKGYRHGSGTAIYADSSYFRGAWVRGNRDGEGVEERTDGSYYSGGWKGCTYHGFGEMRTVDGRKRKGFWLLGQPCSAVVYRGRVRTQPAASKHGRAFERMLDVPLGARDLIVKRLAQPKL